MVKSKIFYDREKGQFLKEVRSFFRNFDPPPNIRTAHAHRLEPFLLWTSAIGMIPPPATVSLSLSFENFNEGSIYCRAKKSKGGTAIYVNKGITSREINVSDLAFEGDIELCAVKCDEVKVTVACVYRPPSGNYKVFFSNFEKLLERICRADATVFVCGDFNINLLEENDKQVKRYGERLTRLLRLNNLNIAIDTPTRVAKGSATLIDNIFTSQNKDFFSACNKDLGLSDHFSQFIYTRVQQETDCSKPGRIKHLYKRVHTD